jgi:3-hydroxyisobutyrate dehydrogenase-like beta-hydroxyacid dehydrogenase
MSPPSVGLIGLGIMGSAMSANLMRAGYRVIGYDLLARRRRDHRRAGGEVARGCRDVARRATIVICSLPSPEALLQVAAELALAPPPTRRIRTPADFSRARRIVIETSTLPIVVKQQARRTLAARGTTLLDCPLSGTGAQARAKDLVVYASGDRGGYRRAVPILEGFARAHYYVGAFGAGSKMKFVANLLVAIHNVAAAEAFVLAMKAGLDPARVLKVIGDGAGSSRMFQVRGPMMVKGDYSDATMKLEVWQKDMKIISDFAREVGCPTPLFAATAPIYAAALAMGRQSEDTAAVCAVLEEMAGARRRRTSSKFKAKSSK